MSTTAEHQQATAPDPGPLDYERGRRRARRRRVVAVGALILVGAAIAVVVVDPFAGNGGTPGGLADNADPTSITTISQGDLTSQTQVSGTLGYSGSYTVVNQA